MRIFLIIIMILHGLIHLFGFLKSFDLAEVEQLTLNISKTAGIFWLITTFLFLIAAALFYFENKLWWLFCSAAIIISQVLIVIYWTDAKFGTIANVILLIPVIIAIAGNLPSSYSNIYKSEVKNGLNRYSKQEILKIEDIKHLPGPIQNYLNYVNVIGKEKVNNFRAEFIGNIKPKPESDFLNFHAVQYNFYDKATRVFYIKSKMLGFPFEALHLYKGSNATMKIKIASLFQIADAKGPKMNKSETVTMFNDMCVFAPATLINKNIEWETIDNLTVKAKFTNKGNTISATLFFNYKGELINFSSNDRFESPDGKIFNNYKWTTPIKNYQEFDGRKLAAYGEAIWHKPEGEFCYGKFNLINIEYNCKDFK